MRLDRYLPENRRLRADSRKQKLLVLGIVLCIYLAAGAGWIAWTMVRPREQAPREVIRFFDITDFPAPTPTAANQANATAPAQPGATTPPAAPPQP
jgi:hypothetical protein